MRVVTWTEPINQVAVVSVRVPMLSRSFTFRSDWSSARRASYRWVIDGLEPGSDNPIEIAGAEIPVKADSTGKALFVWDGRDGEGWPSGPSLARVRSGSGEKSMRLGRWDARSVGLGGLMLSGYDHLDPIARRIHTASGRTKGNIGVRPTSGGFEVTRDKGRLTARFGTDGFLTSVVESSTGRTLASYERSEQGVSRAGIDGRTLTVRRDATTTHVSIEGWGLRLVTDEAGRVTELIDPSERSIAFAYDDAGLLGRVTDSSGFGHSYTYDDEGRLTSSTDPGEGRVDLVRSETDHGHRVTVITAEGRESFQQVERLPDGTKVRTSKCCGDHAAVTRIDPSTIEVDLPNGTKVVNVKASSQRRVTLPSGLTHVRTATGDEVTVNGNTYRTDRDGNGTVSTTPMGRAFEIVETGNTVAVNRPDGTIDMVRDERGRVTQLSEREMTLDLDYDDVGLVSAARWSDGSSTRFEHDPSGWLTAQHLSEERVVRLDRDGGGLVRKVVVPGGGETMFEYDSPDRLASVRHAATGDGADRTDYRYDADGHLISRRATGGSELSFERGIGGEVVSMAQGTWRVDIQHEHGRPVKGSTGAGQLTRFAYDGDLITEITQEGLVNGSVSYGYDESFRRSRISSGDLSADIRYDADGQVCQLGEATIERDDAGRVVSIRAGVVVQTFAYDGGGVMSRMAVSVDGQDVWSVGYTYDDWQRIASIEDSSAPEAVRFSYDDAGRLVGTEAFRARYDLNGNPVVVDRDGHTIEGVTGPGDRLLELGPIGMRYGAGGVVDAIQDLGLTRDGDDMVIAVSSADTTTTLHRDALGSLVCIDHGDGSAANFVAGPYGRPDAVVGPDGSTHAVLVGGTRSDTPLLAIEAGRTLFLAADHVGSVRKVIDIATGEIVESREYDPWGRVESRVGSSSVPYGFAGGLDDVLNGLVYFPARTYAPSLMRWLSRDPRLFLGGSTNLYAYCDNDPVNHRDPTGATVEICRRATDLAIAPEMLFPGKEHWWLRTTNQEAGMVSGGDKVGVGDHAGAGDKQGSECDPVENVDEECVDRHMAMPNVSPLGYRYGKSLGYYGPSNTCQHWVDEVLSDCSSDYGVNGNYEVETRNPEAYDHWYNPDVDVAPYTPASRPPDYTPDPGQSTLDGGALWE